MTLKNSTYVSLIALMLGSSVSLTSFGVLASKPCQSERKMVEREQKAYDLANAHFELIKKENNPHLAFNLDYHKELSSAENKMKSARGLLKGAQSGLSKCESNLPSSR